MTIEKQSFFEKAGHWIKNSVTLRLITIGILILLMLIPVSMIEGLIRERQYRKHDAVREVSSKWGETQTLKSPVLTIPYKTYSKIYDEEEKDKYRLIESIEYAHFLPEVLNINGNIAPEIRYRGIYEVIVYNSDIQIKGSFNYPDFENWKINSEDIMWHNAFLSLGLSDLRSIQNNISVTIGKSDYQFNPGVETSDVIRTGISARIPKLLSDSANVLNFSIDMNFNGSSGLFFTPLGKNTKVNINSAWASPSFTGAFLPEKHDISNKGFSANWEVLHLNRSYPQQFRGAVTGIDESVFGVNLIVTVDEYLKSTRAVKYAVMFISLTFLIFFFVQILNKIKIHPIQYIIVGFALCVFYTLLIAISEQISFMYAYLISGVAVVGLVTAYAANIFKNKKLTIVLCLILILLYVFVFSIIQLEDYALLMGSIGLFITLAIVMYLSRKIDWYAINSSHE